MSDIIDNANDLVSLAEETALKNIRANLKPEAEFTGECLWCGEEHLPEPKRWCDADCRDLWEKSRKRKQL
jgi:hypothetical protein